MSLNQGDDVWGTFTALGPTATAAVLQLRLLAHLPQTFISIRQLGHFSPKEEPGPRRSFASRVFCGGRLSMRQDQGTYTDRNLIHNHQKNEM